MDPSRERVDLETKIAFLEHTVDALNDVILEQGKNLEQLESKLERLIDKLDRAGGEAEERRDLKDDRPPHY